MWLALNKKGIEEKTIEKVLCIVRKSIGFWNFWFYLYVCVICCDVKYFSLWGHGQKRLKNMQNSMHIVCYCLYNKNKILIFICIKNNRRILIRCRRMGSGRTGWMALGWWDFSVYGFYNSILIFLNLENDLPIWK